jgi:hypothetical protein
MAIMRGKKGSIAQKQHGRVQMAPTKSKENRILDLLGATCDERSHKPGVGGSCL